MFNAGRFSQEHLINKTLTLVEIYSGRNLDQFKTCRWFALVPFFQNVTSMVILAIRLSTKAFHVIILLSLTFSRRPEGEGAQQMLYEEAPPRSPTPYLLHTIFDSKRSPFRIPPIDQWDPFHIPSIELCIPFNCCKWAVFNIWRSHKTRKFSRLFLSHKMHLLALLGLFYRPKRQISSPFIYFNKWKEPPFSRSLLV